VASWSRNSSPITTNPSPLATRSAYRTRARSARQPLRRRRLRYGRMRWTTQHPSVTAILNSHSHNHIRTTRQAWRPDATPSRGCRRWPLFTTVRTGPVRDGEVARAHAGCPAPL
jgi:hypothetical protein